MDQEQDGMREHLHSSRQARGLMQYPCSQREGWRIGSGMAGECQQARGRSSSHRGRNAISSRHMPIPYSLCGQPSGVNGGTKPGKRRWTSTSTNAT